MRDETSLDSPHTEFQPSDEHQGYQPRQLVLLGAGYAHLHVLAHWAKQPLTNVRVTLVAPQAQQLYSGMVPGLVAGHYSQEQSSIPIEPLVRRSGIRWLGRSVRNLDAQAQTVLLDDGSRLSYDWLSINTGPVQSRSLLEKSLPGAREHGLFVRPIEVFATLWAQVAHMGAERALRIAIIGSGAAGMELAMAIRQRLPQAAITLLSGTQPAGANYSPTVQERLRGALRQRRITVIQDVAVSMNASEVQLGCGARLACDVPIIATGTHPTPWLQNSGLALDAHGFVAVDAFQRSTSHPQVFAVGDVSSRQDRPVARSGVYAVRAGPTLAHNLSASIEARPLQAHTPPRDTLNLISCGNHYAIASWGRYSAQGRWVWWLKQWIDRQFIARYRKAAYAGSS